MDDFEILVGDIKTISTMSKMKITEGANIEECVRLAFNARMYANLFKQKLGSKFHQKKEEAEKALDRWLKNNIEGINQVTDEEEQNSGYERAVPASKRY